MLDLIKKLFGVAEETFDEIVADFSQTVTRLENRVKTCAANVTKHSGAVAVAEAARDAAQSEADKAAAAAEKIRALFA